MRPRPEKRFQISSLGAILQTLGLVLIVVEDPAARDKTLARREPFKPSNRRVGNQNRLNSQPSVDTAPEPIGQTPAPAPLQGSGPASRASLRVIQSKRGGAWFSRLQPRPRP